MRFIKILAFIFVLIVGGAYGYMYFSFRDYVSDTELKCLSHDFPSEIVANHKQKFCACTADFVLSNPFLSTKNGLARQKFDENTAFCYNKVALLFAQSKCNEFNADGNRVDCTCYENEFVKVFGFGDGSEEFSTDAEAESATFKIMKNCKIQDGDL